MNKEIAKKLINLGFKTGGLGFIYLIDAIELMRDNLTIKTGVLYETVAIKNNTISHSVERAIRHVKEKSNNEYTNMKNNEMIRRLVFEV